MKFLRSKRKKKQEKLQNKKGSMTKAKVVMS